MFTLRILYISMHGYVCLSNIVDRVATLVSTLCTAEICEGNPEERFVNLPNIHNNALKDISRKYHVICNICHFIF